MPTNYEAAIKSEMKRVVRTYREYGVNERTTMMQSRSLYKMALRGGEYRYHHPDCPGVCFTTRSHAAEYALNKQL